MTGPTGSLALALAMAAEISLVGWWIAGGDNGLAATLQLAALMLFGVAALALRYGHLKREHLAGVRSRAADLERTRLAEDLHDLLGHELSLIALEAGRLQVTHPDVADDAARIRERAGSAVDRLQEIVGVISSGVEPMHPAGESAGDVIAASITSGMDVRAELGELGQIARPVTLTVTGLIREGLTNAARHAPGETVSVRTSRHDRQITVEVTNAARGTTIGSGSGLASWERRVRLLSGTFTAGVEADEFHLKAILPACTRLASEPVDVHRPVVDLARGAAIPVLSVLVALTAFWSWSTHDRELSARDFARIAPGQTQARAAALLPAHQARIRLSPEPPRPAGAACRVYTDGNFPLGQSTYRVCFADARVISTADLRQ